MKTQLSPRAVSAFRLAMNDSIRLKIQSAVRKDGARGALWLPEGADVLPAFLLEEGCHSAGFIATIHVRHHLLLSLGWRFTCLPPNDASSITQLKSDVNRPI